MTENSAGVAPNSKEAEMMVLGCMLTSINGLNVAADLLDDSAFYYTEHKIIFQALKRAYKSDSPADVHLICEELKRQDKLKAVGGPGYLTALAQYSGTSAYVEEYVQIVQNKAILREMLEASESIQKKALKEPEKVLEFLTEANDLFKKIHKSSKNGFSDLLEGNSLDQIKEELMNISEGIRTGYTVEGESLELPGGALTIIAGPTAHGKTTVLINFALNILNQHHEKKVIFFTYEEARAPILSLFINVWINKEFSRNNRKSLRHYLKRGSLEYIKDDTREQIVSDIQAFEKYLLLTKRLRVNYSDMTAEQLCGAIRYIYSIDKECVIFIDYMQFLKSMNAARSRQEELKDICLKFKDIAVETGLSYYISCSI